MAYFVPAINRRDARRKQNPQKAPARPEVLGLFVADGADAPPGEPPKSGAAGDNA